MFPKRKLFGVAPRNNGYIRIYLVDLIPSLHDSNTHREREKQEQTYQSRVKITKSGDTAQHSTAMKRDIRIIQIMYCGQELSPKHT